MKLSAYDYYENSEDSNSKYKFHFDLDYAMKISDDDLYYGVQQEDIINNEKRLIHEYCQKRHWSEPQFSRDVSDLCLVGIHIDPEIANRMLRCVYKTDYQNLRKIEVINGDDEIIYRKKGGIDNPEHQAFANLINMMKGLPITPMENNGTAPHWSSGMWGGALVDDSSNDGDSEEDDEEDGEGNEDDENDDDSTETEEEDPELWNAVGMGRRLELLLAGEDNANDDEIVENNE